MLLLVSISSDSEIGSGWLEKCEMSCSTPSSNTWKSSGLRPGTCRPALSVTVTDSSTTSVPPRYTCAVASAADSPAAAAPTSADRPITTGPSAN